MIEFNFLAIYHSEKEVSRPNFYIGSLDAPPITFWKNRYLDQNFISEV